ncbi:MAG TPA: Hsp20/alpha crystallin family protein [Candidatus Rifleibacterium sp.]|nr:Hsp20/alpha crystallin family protein [Candidatus Rifleibacterium sp.]HPT44465.1 Hsp20/alpha crystallin family protein [Candidatus Rifleibacterium sp.]
MAEKTIPANQNNDSQIVKREITRHPEAYVTPLTDIYEEENGLYVMVDMPGVEKTGLKLAVEKDILTIEGHVNAATNDTNYLIREFEPSNYYRQFELSESVDQEKIKAELKNGVLSIFLPKAEALKPRSIDVKIN